MLLARLQTTGTALLDAAGFNVVRVIREGGKRGAVVIGGVIETVILIVAWTVFVLALLIGGIFFLRMLRQSPRPALQQWVPRRLAQHPQEEDAADQERQHEHRP